MNDQDELYMSRALQLAAMAAGDASPNPMVGAVIVADGIIIGEGFHRRCGGPHAEVNAVRSVADPDRLRHATIYVTLEPCAHYGKTPPCARLLIDCGIPRVVIGTTDPFAKVNGKGIRMLEEADIEVKTGVLEQQCRELNIRFMTAHTLHRPYVTLKWARTANGMMGATDENGNRRPLSISSPLSRAEVHRLRSLHDAIMVGSGTVLSDNPRLDTRLWAPPSPRIVTVDRRGRIATDANILQRTDTIVYSDADMTIPDILSDLYSSYGITSLLVEGGPTLLQSFIDTGCFDCIRRETSTGITLPDGVSEPILPGALTPDQVRHIGHNIIEEFNVKKL